MKKKVGPARTTLLIGLLAAQTATAFSVECFNSGGFRRTAGYNPISTLWARVRWTEVDLTAGRLNAISSSATAFGPGCNPVCVGTPVLFPIVGELEQLGELHSVLKAYQAGPYEFNVTAGLQYFDPDAGYVAFGQARSCHIAGLIRPGPAGGGPVRL